MANDIKINLDSKHAPMTAAAWQSWKIITVVFICGFVGITASGLVLGVLALLSNGVPKTEADRSRLEYQRQCQAQWAIDNDGRRADTGMYVCRAEAELAYPVEIN